MSEQLFISYRREGGDITAKLICESLKNHGYSVFYDYDSISGGFFDERIITAIENCTDFILVLPKNSLDRCVNENDWVRQEIVCALKHNKNIIPVMLPEFQFPANLPAEIENIARINAVPFVMAYFEGVMQSIIDRLFSRPGKAITSVSEPEQAPSEGLEYQVDKKLGGYTVGKGSCEDSEIVIPRMYQGKLVVGISDDGFRECATLVKITLPDTIKRIGKSAFNECTALETVNIPPQVTELGGWAFYSCSALRSVYIPKSVLTIGTRAFARCTSVTEFSVDGQNPNFCSFGKHLYSKDMRTLISYAAGCQDTSFTVPATVTVIETSAFTHCASLRFIQLPPILAVIKDYTFNSCAALTKIVLPDTVTLIGEDAFEDCAALESINIPELVSEIQAFAFFGCSSLKTVKIPASVESIGKRAFARCTSLTHFEVDPENESYCAFGKHLYTKSMHSFISYAAACKDTSITIPSSVTVIATSAFTACANLRSVQLPQGVREIGDHAFRNCTALESITLPKALTELGESVFTDCHALKSIQIPSGITAIKPYTFRDCKALTKAILPDTLLSIGQSAFNGCTSLESIDIPGKVTELGKWAFYGCTSLKTVSLPKSAKIIDNRCFANCHSLTGFSISMFNKAFRVKDKHLFTKDMTRMIQFAMAGKGPSYEIPNGVTVIGDCAFSECEKLERLTIPASVTAFEAYAFDKCSKLKNIRFEGTVEAWKNIRRDTGALRKVAAKEVNCANGNVKL